MIPLLTVMRLIRHRAIWLTGAAITLAAPSAGQAHQSASRRLWYAAHTIRDMTGDGHADTLTLEAVGSRPDSLLMIFRIRGAGRELFRMEWSSSERYGDFMDENGRLTISSDSLKQLVRSEIDGFFAPDNFETAASLQFGKKWHVQADGDDPRDYIAYQLRYDKEMAARKNRGKRGEPRKTNEWIAFDNKVRHAPFDTLHVQAIGTQMQRLRLPIFTFSYGYESTEIIIWSPMERKFFEVAYSD